MIHFYIYVVKKIPGKEIKLVDLSEEKSQNNFNEKNVSPILMGMTWFIKIQE